MKVRPLPRWVAALIGLIGLVVMAAITWPTLHTDFIWQPMMQALGETNAGTLLGIIATAAGALTADTLAVRYTRSPKMVRRWRQDPASVLLASAIGLLALVGAVVAFHLLSPIWRLDLFGPVNAGIIIGVLSAAAGALTADLLVSWLIPDVETPQPANHNDHASSS